MLSPVAQNFLQKRIMASRIANNIKMKMQSPKHKNHRIRNTPCIFNTFETRASSPQKDFFGQAQRTMNQTIHVDMKRENFITSPKRVEVQPLNAKPTLTGWPNESEENLDQLICQANDIIRDEDIQLPKHISI